MNLTFIAKDNGSGDGGCPAGYLTDTAPAEYQGPYTDGAVIQGVRLDPAATGQLANLAPHETGVWVPRNVIIAVADAIAAEEVPVR